MTTKQLFIEIVESTYSTPFNVATDSADFWPAIGVAMGLVEPVLTDFVTTMSGT